MIDLHEAITDLFTSAQRTEDYDHPSNARMALGSFDIAHPAADAFLRASDEDREAIRQTYAARLTARRMEAIAAPRPVPRIPRCRRPDVSQPKPDIGYLRLLHKRGLTTREIERRTGIGRNRINRLIKEVA